MLLLFTHKQKILNEFMVCVFDLKQHKLSVQSKFELHPKQKSIFQVEHFITRNNNQIQILIAICMSDVVCISLKLDSFYQLTEPLHYKRIENPTLSKHKSKIALPSDFSKDVIMFVV